MDIVNAARVSELAGLEAIRDKLAADLEVAEPSYSAQIAGRLDAVLARIEAVRRSLPKEVSRVDQLIAAADQPAPRGRRKPSR